MKKLSGVVVGVVSFRFLDARQAAADVLPKSDSLVKTWVPPVYPA